MVIAVFSFSPLVLFFLPFFLSSFLPFFLSSFLLITCNNRFIHRNLFFKFPDDSHNLYGGETFAMKSASHEARGIRAYLEAEVTLAFVLFTWILWSFLCYSPSPLVLLR